MENRIIQLTSCDIAEYFLARANDTGELITNLKLQKLVYYAQAWYLVNFNRPLFDEEFEAWVHGPVIPSLYHKYKEKGSQPIDTLLHYSDVQHKFPPEILEFLEEVTNVYMPFGAYQLELMTHLEKPWIDARVGLEADEKCNVVISKKSIVDYYGQILRNSTY